MLKYKSHDDPFTFTKKIAIIIGVSNYAITRDSGLSQFADVPQVDEQV